MSTALLLSKQYDVYYGVLPRSETRGVKENCPVCSVLFVEIDGRDEGVAGAIRLLCTAMSHDRIPAPGIVVCSGNGLHSYWPLVETIVVECNDLSILLKRLCVAVGGLKWHSGSRRPEPSSSSGAYADPVSTDPPRILRVPGTWNHKPGRNCPVELLDWDGDFTPWTFAQWEKLLPAAPETVRERQFVCNVSTRTGLPPKTEAELHSFWPEGTRHEALRRILYVARKKWFSESDLYDFGSTFIDFNPGCKRSWMTGLVYSTMQNVLPGTDL